MNDTQSTNDGSQHNPLQSQRHPAERPFAVALVVISIVLLCLSPWQVTFFDNLRLFAQPGIWPVVSLSGIALFSLLYAWSQFRRPVPGTPCTVSSEALHWLRTLEYPLWFLLYVWVVPYIGYLIATLLFCPALTWRLGYRRVQPLLGSMAAGVIVVVIFKAFLKVKIPGGLVYESLPSALRNFMILYL